MQNNKTRSLKKESPDPFAINLQQTTFNGIKKNLHSINGGMFPVTSKLSFYWFCLFLLKKFYKLKTLSIDVKKMKILAQVLRDRKLISIFFVLMGLEPNWSVLFFCLNPFKPHVFLSFGRWQYCVLKWQHSTSRPDLIIKCH